jgi:hypothetical protein
MEVNTARPRRAKYFQDLFFEARAAGRAAARSGSAVALLSLRATRDCYQQDIGMVSASEPNACSMPVGYATFAFTLTQAIALTISAEGKTAWPQQLSDLYCFYPPASILLLHCPRSAERHHNNHSYLVLVSFSLSSLVLV